jgi:hypothetical protein
MPVDELFEARDVPLDKCLTALQKRFVTKVDAAAERPGVACGAASSAILPGTGFPVIELTGWRRGLRQQECGLGRGNEERVAILGEPTAATAEAADRTGAGDLGVEIGVELPQLLAVAIQFHRFGVVGIVHFEVCRAASSMSSTLNH